VIFRLVCQMLTDTEVLPSPLVWFVRIGVPLAAILISARFSFLCCRRRPLNLARQSP
jgi:hypothetical protein